MSNITLCEIIREIPAVAAVLSAVPKVSDSKWDAAYTRYKQIITGLVGWYVPEYDNEMLNTDWTYDVAIAALLDALDGVLVLPKPEMEGA